MWNLCKARSARLDASRRWFKSCLNKKLFTLRDKNFSRSTRNIWWAHVESLQQFSLSLLSSLIAPPRLLPGLWLWHSSIRARSLHRKHIIDGIKPDLDAAKRDVGRKERICVYKYLSRALAPVEGKLFENLCRPRVFLLLRSKRVRM